MRIGPLRQRVEIQTPTPRKSNLGAPGNDWTAARQTWASVARLSARELLNAQQVKATASLQVTLRYNGLGSIPKPTHRVKLLRDGRVLNIVSVINVEERNRVIELLCEELVK